MLSIAELEDALTHVRYKEGWTFRVYQGRWEGQHLVITTVVPDAFKPGEMCTLDVHSMLPPMDSTEQFYRWLMWRLGRIEVHEMREFFKIDGKVYDSPHAPEADRDL